MKNHTKNSKSLAGTKARLQAIKIEGFHHSPDSWNAKQLRKRAAKSGLKRWVWKELERYI